MPSTYYEVEITDGSQHYLVGYTARPSKSGLLALARGSADAIISVASVKDEPVAWIADKTPALVGLRVKGLAITPDWTIRFTGRTERFARQNHPLPALSTQKNGT